jgi:hydroxymethylbilane synthase
LGNPSIPSSRSSSTETSPLRIGTRGSPLALAQAHELQGRLAATLAVSASAIEIVIIKTTGDTIQDRPLSESGGKGLFTKELDLALMRGDIDIAVHSSKDLPTILPNEITIAGYLPREDVRDAWISPHALHPRDLAPGSVVGTASLRRGAMVKKLRPDLEIKLLRGNVETRLAKVAKGEVAATLLAFAGLKRLGLEDKASAVLPLEDFLPAAGQGAIGITARRDDEAALALVARIADVPTAVALCAERAFLGVLDGSCKTPIGAYASLTDGTLLFRGIVLRPDGSQFFEAQLSGPSSDAQMLGEAAARDILARLPTGFFES